MYAGESSAWAVGPAVKLTASRQVSAFTAASKYYTDIHKPKGSAAFQPGEMDHRQRDRRRVRLRCARRDRQHDLWPGNHDSDRHEQQLQVHPV